MSRSRKLQSSDLDADLETWLPLSPPMMGKSRPRWRPGEMQGKMGRRFQSAVLRKGVSNNPNEE